jgi:hypothetical protein
MIEPWETEVDALIGQRLLAAEQRYAATSALTPVS